MSKLTVPLFARLGANECQVGSLVVEDGTPSVDVDAEQLRLAADIFTGLAEG